MLRHEYRRSKHIKTNAEVLIGKRGTVSVRIDNSVNQGRVAIDGDDWKAVSLTNEVIDTGIKVEFIKLESIILIVKPV
ncbi:MAG: NfeD family protein [Bacteroidetes bacterium]|nr:NfeD family protein [Bacteroidota bacterium]